jgi:hypothetical protein
MPASLVFVPGRPTNIDNVVPDGQKVVAVIAVITWHILNRSFFVSS